MHKSVGEKWIEMNAPMEGVFRNLYPDCKDFLTAGMGNLADPVALALAMPWKLPSGELASRAQVLAEWNALKAQPKLAQYKASSPVVQNATTIRLNDEDIIALVTAKLLANEREMRKFFSNWMNFPADAQAALFSLSWACGPDFELEFKNCTASANREDWLSCAIEGKLKEAGNPGIIPRNKNNVLLFHNAAAVRKHALDPETLFWPGAAPDVDPEVHQAAVQAMGDAPHEAWDRQLDTLTISAAASLDLRPDPSDYENYNGDRTVSS